MAGALTASANHRHLTALHESSRTPAELHCGSNFSFLTGASHSGELVDRAAAVGYAALTTTDGIDTRPPQMLRETRSHEAPVCLPPLAEVEKPVAAASCKIATMSDTRQAVTPELRAWIVAQAVAGHAPEVVLKSMLASGWDEDTAVGALEDTLTGYLADRKSKSATSANSARPLPPGVPVPEPSGAGTRTTLWAGDREVAVLMRMATPRVVVFGGLLSNDECDEVIALARARLARSETVRTDTGASEVNEARTSEGMFFERGEHGVCARIEARVSALLRWPVENGEGLQVLRYGPGAEYKPHYDYFDPEQPGTPSILERGGQRVASLVCYLNTPAVGGATVFPDVQLEVAPVKGNAVFFSYDRPHPITRTLHGGTAVIEGEKWVATKWLRERRFV